MNLPHEIPLAIDTPSFQPGETPLVFLPRFSEEVGTPVYIKQDDAGPISWAGTKARKVREILKEVNESPCEILVMCGPPQSNSCRALAAGAVAYGIRVILLLRGVEPNDATGNLKIVQELGVDVRWAGDVTWPQLETRAQELVSQLCHGGHRAQVVPPGCSSPTGVRAIVEAAGELVSQMQLLGAESAGIVHASASGGLHAGLTIAHAVTGSPPPQSVMIVKDIYDDVPGFYDRLIADSCKHLGFDCDKLDFTAAKIDWTQLGGGYGIATKAADSAAKLLAKTEGLLVEPVYTAKALAAVVKRAQLRPGEPVTFWHSGGLPMFFSN